MQQQVIFEQFFNNQNNNVQQQSNPTLEHNLLIMEMYNNWPFVRCLMYKHREGRLTQVDEMEHHWITFILNNQIDVESYENKDIFLETHYKNFTL